MPEERLAERLTGKTLLANVYQDSLSWPEKEHKPTGLWRVDDAATAELMVAFYGGLVAGKMAASALREAQLQILSRYRYPYCWAPFVLVGT